MYCSVQNLKPYVHDTNAREIACGQAPTNICHVIISGSLVRDAEIKNNTRNRAIAIWRPFYCGDVYILERNF